jgi:integrase/recombinase XerD
LAWLSKKRLLNPASRPAPRVTPERVEHYVAELRLRVAPVTVAINISYLSAMMQVLEPTVDWRWLRIIGQHLKATAHPIRDKRRTVVRAKSLYDLGIGLMQQAEACNARNRIVATRFRDGLIIAFLVTIPLRLGNFSGIELGAQLLYQDGKYSLLFSDDETKTGRSIDVDIPSHLAFWLERYLRHYRQRLVEQNKHTSVPPTKALWVNWAGLNMSRKAIHHQICHHTRIAFGHAVWPHLFRDCVATSIAIEDPEHVRLVADILGHTTLATADRYYNQASSLSATRTYQQVVRMIRRNASIPTPEEADVQESL